VLRHVAPGVTGDETASVTTADPDLTRVHERIT
jgi:hypothetical protein